MDAPKDSQDRPIQSPRTQRFTQELPGAPAQHLTEEQRASLEARNGLLQFDTMVEMIRAGLAKRPAPYILRPSAILHLHQIATQGLQEDAGRFRLGPVKIKGTEHQPPPPGDVARLVEDLCEELRSRWAKPAIHLAAYVMWKLNWIHPFSDGNGRTTRAVSYLVLCLRLEMLLPGSSTVPQQIATDKFPYYSALDAADKALKDGKEDVSVMETLLGDLLATQLLRVHHAATGVDPEGIACDSGDGGDITPTQPNSP